MQAQNKIQNVFARPGRKVKIVGMSQPGLSMREYAPALKEPPKIDGSAPETDIPANPAQRKYNSACRLGTMGLRENTLENKNNEGLEAAGLKIKKKTARGENASAVMFPVQNCHQT